ncbi:MAG: hypothetical protein JNM07_02325 [Phycisphaerae bacterium]|nr:hypothetical protein [Phycisphaerae bacterium]
MSAEVGVNEAMLYWGLALLGVAFILVAIDLFVPTMGVLLVTALAVAVAGVVCMYRYSAAWGLIGTLVVVVGGPVLMGFFINVMPHTPMGRRLMLGADPADAPSPPPESSELAALVGREGDALTDLRPVGAVRIDGKRFDALAELQYIRAGARIRVTVVVGTQIKVREAT